MISPVLLGAVLAVCVASQDADVDPRSDNSSRWAFIEYHRLHHWEDRPPLGHDVAWLTLNVSTDFGLQIWARSHQCWKCPLVYVTEVNGRNTTTILVNTTATTDIKFAREHKEHSMAFSEDICSFTIKFREHGDYWLFMDYSTAMQQESCVLLLANDPMPSEMPILYTALGLLGLAAFCSFSIKLYSCFNSRFFHKGADISNPRDLTDSTNTIVSTSIAETNVDKQNEGNANIENGGIAPSATSPTKKKARLRSLDTFRGISLVVMIFVNYGGGGYWFFEHPPWDGLTVADLVFPWFIFIMGTSMTFSFRGMYRRQMTSQEILTKVLVRAIKLFALGIILNSAWGPVDLQKLRIPGVLQRFALTYLVISVVYFFFYRKQDSHQDRKWAFIRDVVLYLPEWIIHLLFLALFLALTYALPVPGCPTGYTGPGGLSEDSRYENCTGGAAGYIDVMVLGKHHIYQYPTPSELYQTKMPYDPEGILGTLTSIFLCQLGVQSGRILSIFQEHRSRIIRWLIWGAVAGAIAAILCKGSQYDGWIPLNKNLWSVSFILTMACFAFFLLAVLYVIIDVLDWWGGQPFIYPGMNSIVIYFCHDIFWRVLPINWDLEPLHWKLLLQDVWGATFWILVAYILYRKHIFVAL
ncbi:heparan-alpha-glucosaminide N-acetyltransferase-like isoform X1 [Pomacea canaliculata]|uniref:heparan-alpha-glucosaminide N-acetyltransferase-like isoform X1 n=1 Tax=Pomacea canaliculata TaxID=400727 RepID=UPI000D73AC79|nr:heparan-alpha-glucosaminide N-acetyltransferase-like isoform X1 [Pomacea canaliculata]